MRILFLTTHFPYPPTDGITIKTYNLIKELSKKHDIFLLSFYNYLSNDIQKKMSEMKKYCVEIKTIPLPQIKSSILTRGIFEIFTNIPGFVRKFQSKLFNEYLLDMVDTYNPDIVHVDMINLTLCINDLEGKIPTVTSINDSISLAFHDEIFLLPWTKKYILKKIIRFLQLKKIKKYESFIYPKFDKCHVVSEIDKKYLKSLNPEIDVYSIPNGIDINFFKPQKLREDFPSLVYVSNFEGGAANYAIWFIDKILPKIKIKYKNIKLYLIGKNAQSILLKYAEKDTNIIVTGYVPDIRPYISKATIVISPSMKRCGILNKVLQAMAMAKPVVGTPYSFLAIKGAKPRNHMIIANTPSEFANEIINLIKDEKFRHYIGKNAHNLMKDNYSWTIVANQVEKLYEEAINDFQKVRSKI